MKLGWLSLVLVLCACAPASGSAPARSSESVPSAVAPLWTADIAAVTPYGGTFHGEVGAATVVGGKIIRLELQNRVYNGLARFSGSVDDKPFRFVYDAASPAAVSGVVALSKDSNDATFFGAPTLALKLDGDRVSGSLTMQGRSPAGVVLDLTISDIDVQAVSPR